MRGGSFVFSLCISRKKSTLLSSSGPSDPVQGATDSCVSLHPFSTSLEECSHLFHACVVFPPKQTKFLAQFPQSTNTDNYTELKGKQSLVFVTTAVSEAQFHQFIYILFLNVVRPV